VIGVLEIGGDDEEALGIGVALELDAHAAPYRAPGAVGADQVIGLDLVRRAVDREGRAHAVSVLRDRLHARLEVESHVRHRLELGLDLLRKLPLLALQAEGVVGVAGQQLHVELGDHALLTVALLRVARHQALRHEGLGQAVGRQHVQRGRVEGRGAQVEVELRRGLDHRHLHPGTRQHERRHQAHGPRARDQDVCSTSAATKPTGPAPAIRMCVFFIALFRNGIRPNVHKVL